MEIIILLVLGSALALGLGLSSLTGTTKVQRRLARLADGTAVPIPEERSSDESTLTDDSRSWLVRVMKPFAGHAAEDESDAMLPTRQRLVQAGFRKDSAVTVYMGSRIALGMLLALVALILTSTLALEEMQVAFAACAATGLGFVLPGIYVDRRRAARQNEILMGLPDALDLMVVCVESGLGINASLLRVAHEFEQSNPILSAEFELVNLEIRAGRSSADALRSLADRTGVSEVSSLVAMLVQTERFGTSLADTLRVHADAMRVQRLQRAEEMAAKAPLKMLFPTVLIFFATLLVTIGPGMLQIFAFFGERQ